MIARHEDSPSRSMLRGSPESATLWLFLGKTAAPKTAAPKTAQTMTHTSETLPDDIDALRALIRAERAERATLVARNERLEAII